MKYLIILISLISFFSISNALPHFIYDGIESFHESLGEVNKISFTIYGSLSEEISLEKVKIQNYVIADMGEFQCSLLKNEEKEYEKRTHKILCSIIGNFERRGYILDEPEVYGFDFLNEKGETSWPEEPEKKTFLIGEIGEKIEIDDEPLLSGNINPYVNPLNKVRKNVVDNALKILPKRSSVNKEGMIKEMKSVKTLKSLTNAETAFMIYKWEAQNIVYDCYNYKNSPSSIDYSEDGTYNKGKGVCDGYSKLFMSFANALGLEANRILGYSKGASYQGKLPSKTDHAWNSVKIDGIYYLLDATWGAGSCDGANYKAKFKEGYFCTNPEIFIRTHLPSEKKWQLISSTITNQQFVDMLSISLDFYTEGFKTVSPDAVSFNTDGKFTVKFTYDSNTQKSVLSSLYYLKSNTYYEQPNSCWFEREKTSGVLTCFANEKGTYTLILFGGSENLNNFPKLFEYKITSTKTALIPKEFPITYSIFGSSDLKIIDPLYNPLTRSTMINFKLKTTTFSNLYITNKKNNKYHYRELDKNSNGEFTGEDVYIFGDEVYISTYKGNSYSFIVKYKTIPKANAQVDASFPESFNSPKNILYSPLIDTLNYNKVYFFEIKCDSVGKIAVIEGSNWTFLEKKGNKFSGNVKIMGYDTQVKISYENKDGLYYTMYRYKANK